MESDDQHHRRDDDSNAVERDANPVRNERLDGGKHSNIELGVVGSEPELYDRTIDERDPDGSDEHSDGVDIERIIDYLVGEYRDARGDDGTDDQREKEPEGESENTSSESADEAERDERRVGSDGHGVAVGEVGESGDGVHQRESDTCEDDDRTEH